MLDEVFDALDQKGQEEVQNVLDMLAMRIPKVFVITHSPYIHQYGTNLIQVSQKENGTCIQIVN